MVIFQLTRRDLLAFNVTRNVGLLPFKGTPCPGLSVNTRYVQGTCTSRFEFHSTSGPLSSWWQVQRHASGRTNRHTWLVAGSSWIPSLCGSTTNWLAFHQLINPIILISRVSTKALCGLFHYAWTPTHHWFHFPARHQRSWPKLPNYLLLPLILICHRTVLMTWIWKIRILMISASGLNVKPRGFVWSSNRCLM